MAVKGTESKQNITKELLNYFGDRAFLYNDGKEIRVNCTEAGELTQIKITLTASKTIVAMGEDTAVPGGNAIPQSISASTEKSFNEESTPFPVKPTEDEKRNVKTLLEALGL